MTATRRTGGVLAIAAVAALLAGRACDAAAEVKLDAAFLRGLVEKLPPLRFDKAGKYRGTAHQFRLVAIAPRARKFLVACQVAGEYVPPITGPLASKIKGEEVWKAFQFEVRAGINIEPGVDGIPHFRIAVDEIKRKDLEGIPGTLARLMGKYFDDIVTKVAAGKASSLNDKLNAQLQKKMAAFRDYGVLCRIDYGPDEVVLHFDLSRFRREGVAAYVFPSPAAETVPLRRWAHRRLGSHLYTTTPSDPDPRFFLDDGAAGHVHDHAVPQAVPLYHWSRPRDHFYTTSPDGEGVRRLGYRPNGVACFLYATPRPGTVPLYRFVDPRTAQHYYSTDPQADFAK